MQHGPVHPGSTFGNLPVSVDLQGLLGQRETSESGTDEWAWTASSVAFINDGHADLRCRVWLVASIAGSSIENPEVQRCPDDLIVVPADGHTQADLEFRLSMAFLAPEAAPYPKEIVLIEIGGAERRLTIPFLTGRATTKVPYPAEANSGTGRPSS